MKRLTKETIRQLSAEYGDSFYILDTDVFSANCNQLLNAFRKYYTKTNLAYSYKTNYIPELGRMIDSIGGFAEVVSRWNLR